MLGYDLLGIVPLFFLGHALGICRDLLLLCWSSAVNVLYASGTLAGHARVFVSFGFGLVLRGFVIRFRNFSNLCLWVWSFWICLLRGSLVLFQVLIF